jgi:hypothetical protein
MSIIFEFFVPSSFILLIREASVFSWADAKNTNEHARKKAIIFFIVLVLGKGKLVFLEKPAHKK